MEGAALKAALAAGRFLLLIDGVNELPSEAARRAVDRFRRDYSQSQMVFTTRDVALGGDLGIANKLEMQLLSEAQIQQFIQAYLPTQERSMLQQLQGRARELGKTPLFLEMFCQVFERLKQIPASLGVLFQCFVGGYEKLKQNVPTSEGFRYWKADLLRHLAFTMLKAGKPTELQVSISKLEAEAILTEFLQGKVDYPAQRAKEWLEDLLEYHLIQLATSDQLEFHHQLIQEYYAAEYLLRCLPQLSDEVLKRDYLNYLKWTEPVALMLALVEEEAQALRVVRLAMDEVDLMLGARLAGEVKPALQGTTVGWIDQKELPIKLKIQCWDASRSKHTIPGLLQSLQSGESEVCFRAAGVLCNLGSMDAIPGLLQTLNSQNINACRRAVNTLERLGSMDAIPGLCQALKHQDREVRWRAAKALATLGNETAISALLESLEDPDSQVRLEVAYALGQLNHEAAIPELLRSLKHMNLSIRSRAAKTLGKLGYNATISALIQSFNQSSKNSIRCVIRSCDAKITIPFLLAAISSSKFQSRETVIYALGYCQDRVVVPYLIDALKDTNSSVRRNAIDSLVNYPGDDIIDILDRIFQNESEEWGVRFRAAEALRILGSGAITLPQLVQLLQDRCKDWSLRSKAIEAVAFLRNETAIPSLVNILQNENEDWSLRKSAIEALGDINSKVAIPDLLEFLRSLKTDPELRRSAIEVLARLGDNRAIPVLLQILNDRNHYICISAIEAVGKLGSKNEVYALLPFLKSRKSKIRFVAAEAIGRLGSKAAVPVLLKALKCHSPYADWYTSDQLEENTSIAHQVLWSIASYREKHDLEKRTKAIEALEHLSKGEGSVYEVMILRRQLLTEQGLHQRTNTGLWRYQEGVSNQIFQLLKHSNSRVCQSVVEALSRMAHPKLLSELWQYQETLPNTEIYVAISKIQNRCKFYNYEIWQSYLESQKPNPRHNECDEYGVYDKLIVYTENLSIMTDQQPIFNQQGATIGVNYAASGSKIEVIQGINPSKKSLDILIADYKQFIEQLQENNSAVTDISVIPQILEAEVKLIESQDQQRWRNFLDLKRLWNGSKKAGLKVGEHFAENNPWAKAGIAFLEGVSEEID